MIGIARVVPALKRPMTAADFCNGCVCVCARSLALAFAPVSLHLIAAITRKQNRITVLVAVLINRVPIITYPRRASNIFQCPGTSCSTLARAPTRPTQKKKRVAIRNRCRALSSCQRVWSPPRRTRRSNFTETQKIPPEFRCTRCNHRSIYAWRHAHVQYNQATLIVIKIDQRFVSHSSPSSSQTMSRNSTIVVSGIPCGNGLHCLKQSNSTCSTDRQPARKRERTSQMKRT